MVLYSAVSLVVAVLFVVWAAAEQLGWGEQPDPSATVSGQVELTRNQPVMAVEFEASFVSLSDASGINGQLEPVRPKGDDLTGAEWGGLRYWDGDQWVRGAASEISQAGVNTFRFQWTLHLRDGFDSATVPLEATFYTLWSDGGDAPLPDETIVSDLVLKLVSTYPPE